MITSRDNEKLKLVRKLHERKWREKLGLFAVEGEDLLAEDVEPVELLVSGENVEPSLLAEVSTLAHPPRIVAVQRPGGSGGEKASRESALKMSVTACSRPALSRSVTATDESAPVRRHATRSPARSQRRAGSAGRTSAGRAVVQSAIAPQSAS